MSLNQAIPSLHVFDDNSSDNFFIPEILQYIAAILRYTRYIERATW